MTDYTGVYDPNGEFFEIPHERAAVLVLNSGWSWKPPQSEPALSLPLPEVAAVVAPPDHEELEEPLA